MSVLMNGFDRDMWLRQKQEYYMRQGMYAWDAAERAQRDLRDIEFINKPEPIIEKKEEPKKTMSKKFYKVKKENFMWQVGAILELKDSAKAYQPLEQNELWCVTEHVKGDNTILAEIIENSPDYFERVYPVNLITKTIYKVKEEAMQFINKDYTEVTAKE